MTKKEREAEQAAPEHVPIVAADDLALAPRMIELADKVMASKGGEVDAGDVRAWKIPPPAEAALVHLPKSSLVYVNLGNPRPAEKWVPGWLLQNASLNGWAYLSAKRLYEPPSVPIFMALEHAFGRSELWSLDKFCGGMLDHTPGGSASHTIICRYQGSWLPLTKVSLTPGRKAERQRLSYPDIRIL